MPSTIRGSDNFDSASLGIGYGQTWQNMTSSRALSTTYTNSTGKPIQVLITQGYPNIGGQSTTFYINGNTVSAFAINVVSGGGGAIPFAMIIPNGATYQLAVTAGSNTLQTWWELR